VKTASPPREDVEPAVDGDADLEEAHRNQGSRNALCALPSYTSGIQEIPRQAAGLEKIQIFVSSLISALLSKLSFSPRLTALLRHNHKLQVRPPRHSSPLHGPTNNNNISIVLRSSSSNLPQVPRSSAIREPPHSRLVDLPHLSNHYWSLKRQKLSSISSIFGIQALDHVPHGCCLISTSHSWYPCYSSQAVLRKHSLVPPQFFALSYSCLFVCCGPSVVPNNSCCCR
jgi:hypothetical protein